MEITNLIPHIEALIFASDKPLTSLDITDLLNNAFDACVHGEKPWIRIELKDLENWIEVAVSNSGPLIQEEIRNKLFEPFLFCRL